MYLKLYIQKKNILTDAKVITYTPSKSFRYLRILLHPLFKVISVTLIWKRANYTLSFLKIFQRTPSNLS